MKNISFKKAISMLAFCFLLNCAAYGFDVSFKQFVPGIEVRPGDRRISDIALSPDGSTLYAAYWTDSSSDPIVAYSTTDYSVIGTMPYGRCHGGVDVSNDGRYVYATTYYQGNVSRFDRNNGNARTALSAGSWAWTMDKSPDGTRLVVGSGQDGYGNVNGAVYVYNIAGGNFASLGSVYLSQDPVDNQLAFSKDGQYSYLTTYKGSSANPRLYEISITGAPIVSRQLEFSGSGDGLSGVAADEISLFVADSVNKKIWIVDKSAWSITDHIDVPYAPGTIAMHPDGKHLFVLSPAANRIMVIDTGTKEIVDSVENLVDNPHNIEFSHDGLVAYVAHRVGNGGITVLQINTPEAQLLFRSIDSWTSWIIPGFDHVGLLAPDTHRVWESHGGYDAGYYLDPEVGSSVYVEKISGVQMQHTRGSFLYDSKETVTETDTICIDPTLGQDMVDAIASLDTAGFAYIAFFIPDTKTILNADIQKGSLGSFTCVGLIEWAAEQAGHHNGDGFVPQLIEDNFLLAPLVLRWCAKYDVAISSSLSFLVGWLDPVDFILTDPQGRRLGHANGTTYDEIPNAFYSGDGDLEMFGLAEKLPGYYRVEFFGTGEEYNAVIKVLDKTSPLVQEQTFSGYLSEGETANEVLFDNEPPVVAIISPEANNAVQDGITLKADVNDISPIDSVSFSIREPNSGSGVPIGKEDLAGTFNSATGKWECNFNTTQLQDGYYVVLAKGVDSYGNVGWSQVVPFSIRNWAIITMLPSTPNSQAGRTMPVKFSLRIAQAVDPAMPFVYNDELEIRIYDKAKPSVILQRSVFGSGSTNYRIDTGAKMYITNFKTGTKPATYVVEIWRPAKNFMVGSFTFATAK